MKLLASKSLRKRIVRSPALQRLAWASEALVLALFWQASAWLSPDRASTVGRRLMRAVGPRFDKSRYLKRNLRLAFPDRTEPEIEALIREIWGGFGAVLAEYPHLKTICDRGADQRIEIVFKGDIQALRQDSNKRAIFVTAHLANWEMCAAAGTQVGLPLTVVYNPLQNPWIDRMLQRKRQALGCSFVTKDDAARQMLRQLAKGGSIGLLVDRRTDTGEPVPFFGLDKLTTVIPARLALKFDCELVPVRVERLSGARFRVTAYDPVRADDEGADEHEKMFQMMRKINMLFETWIREQPHDWYCANRIWPKTATSLNRAS